MGFTIDAVRSWETKNQDETGERYRAVMAHVYIRSPYRVGRYDVDISAVEKVGITALREGIRKADIIIVDEIGTLHPISARIFRTISPRCILYYSPDFLHR